jgi:hypothetical protein
LTGKQSSNPCPELANCHFQKNILDAAAEVIKNMYCNKNYEKCSRFQLKAAGAPVPDNLWPNGKECRSCKL